ncbi:hypothetical protein BH11BAC4_BH11BAC4_08890 [soil metagenome]
MKKSEEQHNGSVKPDLKHDTMEYAASTDGDDILDMDKENEQEIEDEDITADELELLEEGSIDDQAAALNSVETDRRADDDLIFDEADIEENYEDENEEEQHVRR